MHGKLPQTERRMNSNPGKEIDKLNSYFTNVIHDNEYPMKNSSKTLLWIKFFVNFFVIEKPRN